MNNSLNKYLRSYSIDFWQMFFIAVVVGGSSSTGYPSKAVETYGPGLTCVTALPDLPKGLSHPAVNLIPGTSTLLVCGTNYPPTISCFTWKNNEAAWTPVGTPSPNYHRFFASFFFGTQLFVIDDFLPEAFDTAGNTWSNAGPPITSSQTGGGGCTVVLGDYVYLFGGRQTNAIRRMFLKAPVNTWTWEYLNELPVNTLIPGCAPLPTNKNIIVVTLGGTTVLYDIYQNTVTNAPTSADLAGNDLLEICHDSKLFAVATGSTAKVYPKSDQGGLNQVWQDVTTGTNLAFVRTWATSIVVGRKVVSSAPGFSGTCTTGC